MSYEYSINELETLAMAISDMDDCAEASFEDFLLRLIANETLCQEFNYELNGKVHTIHHGSVWQSLREALKEGYKLSDNFDDEEKETLYSAYIKQSTGIEDEACPHEVLEFCYDRAENWQETMPSEVYIWNNTRGNVTVNRRDLSWQEAFAQWQNESAGDASASFYDWQANEKEND